MGPCTPTISGFLAFLRGAGFPVAAIPDTSPTIGLAFRVAMAITAPQLRLIDPLIYELAVYNLATSNVVNYAQDQPGGPTFPGSGDPPLPYFQGLRKSLHVNSFVAGVVQAAADESTSDSLLVPEVFKNLTIANLQQLKDPWGRQYLAFVSDLGNLASWGVS